MNNEKLMIFENPEFGKVRTMSIDGCPWFMGKDVAQALGYTNTNKALSDHCRLDGVTFRYPIDSMGRPQKAKYISEGNVYRLITHSKLPSAEKFERWVFDEVIPSIRKYGAYVTDEVLKLLDEHPELIPEYFQWLRDENAKAKAAQEALEKALAENALLVPKASYYDFFVDVDSLTNITYTAKELKIPRKKFVGYLLEKGYVYRDRHRKGRLFARAGKRNDPLFMTKDFYLPDGTKSEYTLVTPDGKAYFQKKYEEILAWVPGDNEEGEAITEQAVFADNCFGNLEEAR